MLDWGVKSFQLASTRPGVTDKRPPLGHRRERRALPIASAFPELAIVQAFVTIPFASGQRVPESRVAAITVAPLRRMIAALRCAVWRA
jgi:hypothetical protein